MSSIVEMITRQLDFGSLEQISRSLGADRDSTSKAVAGAIPILVSALADNAGDQRGAVALSDALARDHDGSVLDDLAGLFSGGRSKDGNAILGHVLGDRRSRAEAHLGQVAGLSPETIRQLLPMLAPLVMGALGKAQRDKTLDPAGLGEVLRKERKHAAQAAPDLVTSVLDADGDGQVLDDIAQAGLGLLGKLMRQR